MADQPWKTDQWFSSPWNYLPEIADAFNLPEKVKIHDVTLRDGEQQAGVEFTTAEKLRIATLLAVPGAVDVMQFLDGVDLGSLLGEPMDQARAIGYARQIFAGLDQKDAVTCQGQIGGQRPASGA